MNPLSHLSRRAWIKGVAVTGAGLALPNWGSLAHARAAAEAAAKNKKKCVLLWMNGGASQIDTFDMKPGQPTGGAFRPVASNVTGLQVCEYLPKISQMADKLAVIRSMHTSQPDHPGGIYLMHTGYGPLANVS